MVIDPVLDPRVRRPRLCLRSTKVRRVRALPRCLQHRSNRGSLITGPHEGGATGLPGGRGELGLDVFPLGDLGVDSSTHRACSPRLPGSPTTSVRSAALIPIAPKPMSGCAITDGSVTPRSARFRCRQRRRNGKLGECGQRLSVLGQYEAASRGLLGAGVEPPHILGLSFARCVGRGREHRSVLTWPDKSLPSPNGPLLVCREPETRLTSIGASGRARTEKRPSADTWWRCTSELADSAAYAARLIRLTMAKEGRSRRRSHCPPRH